MPAIGIGISPVFGGGNPVSLDPDYTVYEAAMSVAPSASWRAAVNQMVLDIKAALSITSLSDAFDAMWFLAAETEQAALLNLVKRSHDCTNVSMTFTASRGFTGNGTSAYLNTNYNPSTQGVRLTLNSAMLGMYCRTNVAASQHNGCVDTAPAPDHTLRINPSNGINMLYAINQASDNAVAQTSGLRWSAANRSESNAIQVYRDDSQLGTTTTTSTSVPNLTFYIGAHNVDGSAAQFTTRQIALFVIGGSLTQTQHANFYTAVQTALTAIGAAV